jgi:glucan phosphoethanolaminetransferase (alkaline phosphatase superfamily)
MKTRLRPSPFHTIVLGGLAVGVLDCLAAMANAAISGVMPGRVWQYVASSVLGPESFNAGAMSIAIGLLFHFCVAFGVAIGFFILSSLFPIVLRHAVVSGIVYGIAVYFAMSYVIVPLTMARQSAFNWYGLISGLIIHMLFVGLPVALIARRFAK